MRLIRAFLRVNVLALVAVISLFLPVLGILIPVVQLLGDVCRLCSCSRSRRISDARLLLAGAQRMTQFDISFRVSIQLKFLVSGHDIVMLVLATPLSIRL